MKNLDFADDMRPITHYRQQARGKVEKGRATRRSALLPRLNNSKQDTVQQVCMRRKPDQENAPRVRHLEGPEIRTSYPCYVEYQHHDYAVCAGICQRMLKKIMCICWPAEVSK